MLSRHHEVHQWRTVYQTLQSGIEKTCVSTVHKASTNLWLPCEIEVLRTEKYFFWMWQTFSIITTMVWKNMYVRYFLTILLTFNVILVSIANNNKYCPTQSLIWHQIEHNQHFVKCFPIQSAKTWTTQCFFYIFWGGSEPLRMIKFVCFLSKVVLH